MQIDVARFFLACCLYASLLPFPKNIYAYCEYILIYNSIEQSAQRNKVAIAWKPQMQCAIPAARALTVGLLRLTLYIYIYTHILCISVHLTFLSVHIIRATEHTVIFYRVSAVRALFCLIISRIIFNLCARAIACSLCGEEAIGIRAHA